VSTFGELFEQAEQEIRAHIESAAAEFTNYFVVQGAVLLASIRLWAQLCGKTETDQRAMVESSDKSSLEKVVEDLAEARDPEGVMASQLLKAIVNRPESFVAEVCHWASRAFADGKGERRSTDSYDRPMSCCGRARLQIAHPPQSLRLTCRSPAKRPVLRQKPASRLMRLRGCLMFRFTRSISGTRKAPVLRVIRCTRRAITEGATSSGGWRSKG
jgi:hypothetical protein